MGHNVSPYGTNFMPQIQMPQIPQMQAQLQPQHIDRVHGEAGADAYQMAPNSDVLLLDETAPIIWFVQTDAAGYKSKYPYDITPHKTEAPPDPVSAFDERLNSMDSRLKALEEALK